MSDTSEKITEITNQTEATALVNDSSRPEQAERKKRRKSLKDSELKLKILGLIDQGHKVSNLAIEYNVGATTIRDWMKCRDKIVELDKLNKTCNLSKKTLKSSDFPQVDKALCIWYYQEKALNRLVNGQILCEKARYFKQYLDVEKTRTIFTASHGFIANFFQRHGLKAYTKKAEESTLLSEQEPFIDELNRLIQKENYSPHQIFNLEEAGLFWKNLPDETYGASKHKLMVLLSLNHEIKLYKPQNDDHERIFKNEEIRLESIVLGS